MAEIVATVASLFSPAIELGKVIAAPIKRQFTYLCCFKSNIQSLSDETGKLKTEKDELQRKVDTANRNIEVIVPKVKEWLDDFDEIQVKTSGIQVEITNAPSGCLAIRSRYPISKKAKKTADAMKDLRERCKFEEISRPALPASMAPIPQGPSDEFPSRKEIEEKMMEDLRGGNVHMMGICGMGGVGKTTLAKRIMNKVREENLFDEVVMAVVSQPVVMQKIQGEIAEWMDLDLKEESLSARAYKLRARLMGAKSILLILDDVWEELNLEEVGIPSKSDVREGCTIVLTSRNMDVLRNMGAKDYAMEILPGKEAWSLFIQKVGTWVDDSDLLSIATEVSNECNGLPLALITVGTTLANEKSKHIWEDALHQLKSSNPIDMPDVLKKVYKPLKLSYESLDNQNARSLFLLCCLFPEDCNINLKYLIMYGIGLRMFEGMSMEEARNRVCTLVKMLKGLFLLLDGYGEDFVKMHDVVRDVAIVIASEEGLVDRKLSSKHCWGEESINCTWISMMVEQINKLPIGLSFPSLRLLSIDNSPKVPEISINPSFFQGMKELNVLSFHDISCRSLPETTQLLKNLRTLYLHRCNSLKTISIVGQLLSLEILLCRDCNEIAELPVEIGRLERLKLLEVSYCSRLRRIAPGVISKLVQLEELIIVGSFRRWERKANGKQRDNAALCELEHLKNLTRLEIDIEDVSLVAEEICLSSKIVNHRIRVSSEYTRRDFLYGHERAMHLILGKDITLAKWIHVFLRSSHYLWASGDGSNNLDLAQAQNLKRLIYSDCSTMNKLVNITTSMDWNFGVFPFLESLILRELPNLEEICKLPKASNSFGNLKELKVDSCHKLRKLFPLAIAKDGLLLLEKLEIENCEMMEEVFANEENEKDGDQCHMITFPKLKELSLSDLPSLTTFCKGSESIEFPLLKTISIQECIMLTSLISGNCDSLNLEGHDADSFHLFCNQKVSFGSLKEISMKGYDNITSMWCHQIPLCFFTQLEELRIEKCKGLRCLFSSSIAENLVNLKKLIVTICDLRKLFPSAIIKDGLLQLETLVIEYCLEMEEVFSNEKNGKDIGEQCHRISFPKLKSLKLLHLSCLTSFCKGSESIEFPLLETISIEWCRKLTSLICSTCDNLNLEGHDDDSVHQNQKVSFGCLKRIFFRSYDISNMWCHQISFGFFSQLESLVIKNCNGIRSLFPSSIAENLVNLKELHISGCNEMVKVIEDDEEMLEPHLLFPRLKELRLEWLPKFPSFCNWRCDLKLPSLEQVYVRNCPLLELESVIFGSLKKIDIFGCNGGGSLFSSSIAKNLVNLDTLEIGHCKDMVNIIEDIDEEMLSEKSHQLFPSLKELLLWNLPKLQSFCNWRCGIQLPSLEQVDIDSCPLLEFFTVGYVNTPNLRTLTTDHSKLKDVGDLNGAIQQHFETNPRQPFSHTLVETTSSDIEGEEEDHEKSEIEEEEINEGQHDQESTSAQVKVLEADQKRSKIEEEEINEESTSVQINDAKREIKEGEINEEFTSAQVKHVEADHRKSEIEEEEINEVIFR